MKKAKLTESKAENNPSGGVLIGKRKGQTIIHNKGTLSGYLVGKTHAEGGIKAINKSTGQPLEMQGGEVVITAPAVSDQTKREFEGEMLTNREILSKINEKGGGVAFAKDGMEIPKSVKHTGASYNYGGKTMTDHEILMLMNNGGNLAKGMTLKQIADKHDVSLSKLNHQVKLGLKAESEHTSSKRKQMQIVKDHLFENPNYYTLLKKAGLKDGGEVKTWKQKYNKKYGYPANESHDLKEIAKDTGVSLKGLQQIYNKGIGAYKTNPQSVRPNVKSKEQWAMARVYSAVMGGKASKVDANELKIKKFMIGGYDAKTISDFENPKEAMEYVDKEIVGKAVGIYIGGKVPIDTNELKMNTGGKVNLVSESKKGDHPSRDLNNYNDLLDVGADGKVGMDNGLAFDDGGELGSNIKKGDFLVEIFRDNEGNVKFEKLIKVLKIERYDFVVQYINAPTFIPTSLSINGDDYRILTKSEQEELFSNPKILILSDMIQKLYETYSLNSKFENALPEQVLNTYLKENNFPKIKRYQVYDGKKIVYDTLDDGFVKTSYYKKNYNYANGGDIDCYADGGSLDFLDDVDKIFARGGATDVVVNNWNEIPDDFKNIRLPKQIDYRPYPNNDGLYEIVKPFLGVEDLRPEMQGMNFDDNGITTTNTHILLTIPTDFKEFQGIYKYNEKEEITKIDAKYPNYAQVFPKEKDITKTFDFINIEKLLTYCKVAKNYAGNQEIVFKINNEQMQFFPDYIIDVITSWIKLTGLSYAFISFQTNKRALVFHANPKFTLGKDRIALIMPNIYGSASKLGARNTKKKAELNVYFDFDDNDIHNSDGSVVADWMDKPKKTRAKRTPKTTSVKPETKPFDLSDTKIWIGDNQELSRAVQKKAFELGWDWIGGNKTPQFLDGKSLYFWKDKEIAYSDGSKTSFDNDSKREIFASDLMSEAPTKVSTQEMIIQPSQSADTKPTFELERKFLTSRINEISLELNVKKIILTKEEAIFYQREINKFIKLLRNLNEKELSQKLISERFDKIYSVKFGDFKKEYPSADLKSINGLQTQLTEQEFLDVRTPEFKAFFGDWQDAYLTGNYESVSKVINEKTKEPMPVYHGTNVLFTNWKTYDTNNAHYFAVRRDFSDFFATTWEERSDKSALDSKTIKNLNPNKGTFMFRCFIDVKNPIDFSKFGVDKYPVSDFLTYLKINYNISDYDFWTNIDFNSGVDKNTLVYAWQIIRLWQSFTQYVKLFTTYDGYIFYEYLPDSPKLSMEDASLCYCAFDSNQIKFNDAYEFNALSNDSRFDFGGKI